MNHLTRIKKINFDKLDNIPPKIEDFLNVIKSLPAVLKIENIKCNSHFVEDVIRLRESVLFCLIGIYKWKLSLDDSESLELVDQIYNNALKSYKDFDYNPVVENKTITIALEDEKVRLSDSYVKLNSNLQILRSSVNRFISCNTNITDKSLTLDSKTAAQCSSLSEYEKRLRLDEIRDELFSSSFGNLYHFKQGNKLRSISFEEMYNIVWKKYDLSKLDYGISGQNYTPSELLSALVVNIYIKYESVNPTGKFTKYFDAFGIDCIKSQKVFPALIKLYKLNDIEIHYELGIDKMLKFLKRNEGIQE